LTPKGRWHTNVIPCQSLLSASLKPSKSNTRRAKQSGISAGALVRRLLNEHPFTTSAELLKGLEQCMGDKTLRVRRKK